MYQVQMFLRKPNIDIYDPILKTTGRIREARGFCKQTFDSQINVLMKHEYPFNGDEIISREDYTIKFIENGEVIYRWWLEIQELCKLHNRIDQVCGTLMCSLCYEAQILAEPLGKDKVEMDIISTYDPSAHRYKMKGVVR